MLRGKNRLVDVGMFYGYRLFVFLVEVLVVGVLALVIEPVNEIIRAFPDGFAPVLDDELAFLLFFAVCGVVLFVSAFVILYLLLLQGIRMLVFWLKWCERTECRLQAEVIKKNKIDNSRYSEGFETITSERNIDLSIREYRKPYKLKVENWEYEKFFEKQLIEIVEYTYRIKGFIFDQEVKLKKEN